MQMAEDAEGNPVPNLAVSEVLHKVYEKVRLDGAQCEQLLTWSVGLHAASRKPSPGLNCMCM